MIWEIWNALRALRRRETSHTSQGGQRVVAALLLAGKEAIAVQEVRPGHLDDLEGVGAVLPQRLAGAAAGLDHPVVAAGRGQHRAAHQPDLRGALPVQQTVDDAQEQVLRTRLGIQAGLVAQDVWENCPGAEEFQQVET